MRTIVTQPEVFLRQKGIKASFQRVRIFDYLQNSQEHPSVSKIFDDLHPHIPSLSRATVYNTINLFLEKHLVIPVPVEGTEARYDLSDPIHAHFYCTKCGQIFDVDTKAFPLPAELKGFEVSETQLLYKGHCPQCVGKTSS